jgi:hypothetical protein
MPERAGAEMRIKRKKRPRAGIRAWALAGILVILNVRILPIIIPDKGFLTFLRLFKYTQALFSLL